MELNKKIIYYITYNMTYGFPNIIDFLPIITYLLSELFYFYWVELLILSIDITIIN